MLRHCTAVYRSSKGCLRSGFTIARGLHTNHGVYKQKKHTPSIAAVNMATFKFTDYECIGFDLDNTLLYYKITNQTHLIYNTVAKHLTSRKGYSPKYLLRPLSNEDYDFMQKGLLLDFQRGNILRISPNGLIQRVCHGTKLLSAEEIRKIYPDQRCDDVDKFCKDYIATWNGPISERMRNFLDYFDISSPLVFAKLVDTLDEENGGPLNSYNIWPDILEALVCMFTKYEANSIPDYFSTIEQNPDKYLHKSSEETLSWLREIKKGRVTFLITGSYPAFVESNASYAFGKDWRSLFDIVICMARKPNFFICNRPFYNVKNGRQNEVIDGKDLKRGEMYIGGCWEELLYFFKEETQKSNPSCLYVGDNLLQDIYAASVYIKCDTVAVIEEQMSEGMVHHGASHPDEKILNSNIWGSYFCLKDAGEQSDSLWGYVIRKYSKLCIPNISFLTKNPIDFPYPYFEENGRKYSGYYPGIPLSISTF